MSYLVAPLHVHFDSGFGATGDAFKEAADILNEQEDAINELFNRRLPINYLYRHAVELFLKSAIVIFHRRLNLPYGSFPPDADPMVYADGEWKPFNRVHSIALLWGYTRQLFRDHSEWLAKNTMCGWSFATELDGCVQVIEARDPRSTFFRYPTTTDPDCDVSKSAMKEVSESGLSDALRKSNPPESSVFFLVVENEQREFVRGYVYDDESGTELASALRVLAAACYNLHAQMRFELCDNS